MRIRILFPYLLLISATLLFVGWYHARAGRHAALQAAGNPAAPPAGLSVAPPPTPAIILPLTPAAPVAAPPDPQEIDNRIASLNELAMNEDAGSLNPLLASLTDPDPQIRAAALDATIQFDRPEAIPALENARATVDSPAEKVNLQEAIDYIKLPTFIPATTNAPPP